MTGPTLPPGSPCGNSACTEALQVARQARARAEAELALLRDCVLAVTAAPDIRSALQVTIDRVLAATGWMVGEAWVPAPDGTQLVASGAWSARAPEFAAFREASRTFTFARGVGLPGRAWESGTAVWIPDVTADANFPRRELARAAGLRAAFGIPILAGSDVVAVLDCLGTTAQDRDPQLLDLVAAVAAHLGTAVQGKRAEEALRQSEARFRNMVRNALDSVTLLEADGTVAYQSPALARIAGILPESIVGRPLWDVVHPDDVTGLRETLARAWDAPGTPLRARYRLRARDGRWRTLEAIGSRPVGEAVAILNSRDTTEREALEAQLRHAQRLDSLGRLSGGVAHDFNNVLGAVLGYADLVLGRLPADDPLRDDVLEIQRAGQRAAALTRQLLAFARKQVLEPHVIDLNALVGDLHGMLVKLIGEDIEFSFVPASGPARVRVDPGQIEQVIVNLAVNARDAMPHGGKVTIELSEVELDDGYVATHAEVAPGPYVRLAVSDTGTGMDAATRARLFEPFFTTKGPGKGTGLGLATAHGIVRQSGGHIWVYSEPGHGTTFKIYLPRVEGQTETFRRATTVGALPRGRETVVVVEDDPALRRLTVRVLAELGYRVLEAGRGDEGLVVTAGHTGPIHLLLTDVVMPGLCGRALAEAFLRERPDARVLFVSGYTANAIVHHGELDPGVAYLAKPFTPDGLARRVREVLDAPGPA